MLDRSLKPSLKAIERRSLLTRMGEHLTNELSVY